MKKKNLFPILGCIFIILIILTVIILSQWNTNNVILKFSIIGAIWIVVIVISYFSIKEFKNNPYPLFYLIDYETLIRYMNEEEKFCYNNNLEAGFHFYLYQNENKIEILSWYYPFSSFEAERSKGNIYYWNKEEFNSLASLIENKINKFDGYILIELIDSDSTMLNQFKKNHKELDVVKYIENLHTK